MIQLFNDDEHNFQALDMMVACLDDDHDDGWTIFLALKGIVQPPLVVD